MARRRYSDDWDTFYPPSKPRHADGIRAQSQRGSFARNWWAQRWLEVLESFGWHSRLQRGRTYARAGQVLGIDVQSGRVVARIQGSRRAPYLAQITVRPLSDGQWERAIGALAKQALFAAQLLAGEMPPEIEHVLSAAGVSLFPDDDDIRMSCSCPDFVVPCKHLAAVYYLLGEELDHDPFLLFALRGRTREQVMQALQTRRAASALAHDVAAPAAAGKAAATPKPPDLDLASFWQRGEDIEEVLIVLAPPTVETALLKRMGSPAFSRRPEAFIGALSLVYSSVARRALEFAFDKDDTDKRSAAPAGEEQGG